MQLSEVQRVSDNEQPSEIVAITYGGIDVRLGCVLVEMWVRLRQPDGRVVIGARDPFLTHYDVLAGVSQFEPELMKMVAAKRVKREVLRPVSRPLPDWEQGPDLLDPKAYWWFCQGWGYADVDGEIGAVRLWLEASAVEKASSTDPADREAAEYLIAYRTLPAYHRGLRHVLRKMEALGIKPSGQASNHVDVEKPPTKAGIH